MPESPEVKVITDQLHQKLTGHTVTSFQILGGRFSKENISSLEEIRDYLPLKIEYIKCKGKFIYWKLGYDWFLWNTLGMTGEWSSTKTKHAAFSVCFNDNIIYFNDIRHFGTIKFSQGEKELAAKLNSLGPDILSEPPSRDEFYKIIHRYDKSIAEILMDQKILSGIGNYIKAESLYRAKISPWRSASSLSKKESESLYEALRDVVQSSYSLGGNSLKDYKDVNGKEGSYSNFLLVYGKKRDPLGFPVIREETLDKRTTWWVKEIQV